MTMETEPRPTLELFPGQMIALAPVRERAGQGRPAAFPRNVPSERRTKKRTARPKSYTVVADGLGGGTIKVRQVEIEVDILPLDTQTPPSATVFRVVAVTGNAIRVTAVVEERAAPGSAAS